MAVIHVWSAAVGDDSGDSWANARPSLNTALEAANIAPGDILLVSGTFNETVTITEVGTPTAPVVVKGDDRSGTSQTDDGAPAQFTVDGQSSRANCVTNSVSGSIYHVWKHAKFTGATGVGFLIGVDDNITFKDCVFTANTDDGVNGDNNCRFFFCTFDTNGGNGAEVDTAACFYGCEAFSNTGASLGQIKLAAGTVFSTLVYGLANGDDGIHIDANLDAFVVNCTIDGGNTTTSEGIVFEHAGAIPVAVINNIIYDLVTGVRNDNNLGESTGVYNNLLNSNSTADYSGMITGTDDQSGAPGFISEDTNYTPDAGSVALANGADASTTTGETTNMDIGSQQGVPPAGGSASGVRNPMGGPIG